MPRAGTPKQTRDAIQARHRDKKREAGWVRGPRIRIEAQEHVRELAHHHRLSMEEVASRLILGEALTLPRQAHPLGLSASEIEFLQATPA